MRRGRRETRKIWRQFEPRIGVVEPTRDRERRSRGSYSRDGGGSGLNITASSGHAVARTRGRVTVDGGTIAGAFPNGLGVSATPKSIAGASREA